MNIFIDIDRSIGANGKAMAYFPQVHWTIDDADKVTNEQMESARQEIQNALEKIFKGF